MQKLPIVGICILAVISCHQDKAMQKPIGKNKTTPNLTVTIPTQNNLANTPIWRQDELPTSIRLYTLFSRCCTATELLALCGATYATAHHLNTTVNQTSEEPVSSCARTLCANTVCLGVAYLSHTWSAEYKEESHRLQHLATIAQATPMLRSDTTNAVATCTK